MNFDESDEFTRELKKLKRKYSSLEEDLESLKPILMRYPEGRGEKHWNCLTQAETYSVWKNRLACKTLRNSSLRVIYVYFPQEQKIVFLEIYFKGDKENEDKKRLQQFLKGLSSI